MQGQMSHGCREKEPEERTIKKCEIKNTVTKIKNTFDELINRLGMAEKSFELEDISIETSKTKKKKEQRLKKKNRTSNYGKTKNDLTYT